MELRVVACQAQPPGWLHLSSSPSSSRVPSLDQPSCLGFSLDLQSDEGPEHSLLQNLWPHLGPCRIIHFFILFNHTIFSIHEHKLFFFLFIIKIHAWFGDKIVKVNLDVGLLSGFRGVVNNNAGLARCEEKMQCPDWAFSPTTSDCKKTTI